MSPNFFPGPVLPAFPVRFFSCSSPDSRTGKLNDSVQDAPVRIHLTVVLDSGCRGWSAGDRGRPLQRLTQIGRALIRQKARLGHGMFLKWIDAEFGMSSNTVMRSCKSPKYTAPKSPTWRIFQPPSSTNWPAQAPPKKAAAKGGRVAVLQP